MSNRSPRVGREGAQNTPFDQGARATQQRLACQRTGRWKSEWSERKGKVRCWLQFDPCTRIGHAAVSLWKGDPGEGLRWSLFEGVGKRGGESAYVGGLRWARWQLPDHARTSEREQVASKFC